MKLITMDRNSRRSFSGMSTLIVFVLILHLTVPIRTQAVGEDQYHGKEYRFSSALDYGDSNDNVHTYVKQGDINLGAVFSIHKYDKVKPCGKGLRESGVVQHAEAMVYAINNINANPRVLQDVNLGFVILDDCLKPTTALAQVMHFMPGDDRRSGGCDTKQKYTNPKGNHDDQQITSHGFSSVYSAHSGHHRTFYDVVGVIGAESSPSSIMMANVLTLFGIPQISHTSTSDLLSDKNKFPYFMRMIPPDRFQVKAIVHILLHFNWTYVSVVYNEGGYGQKAVEKLLTLTTENGICVMTTVSVSVGQKEPSFTSIVNNLYKNGEGAKVVILYTDQEEARGILTSAGQLGRGHYFTWLGSDGLGVNVDDLDDLQNVTHGSLVLKQYSEPSLDFEEYFLSLSPDTNDNPWLKPMWSELFHCDWAESASQVSCDHFKQINKSLDYSLETTVPVIIDIVYTFAHALHRLRNKHCPGATGHNLTLCVWHHDFLRFLKETTFEGLTGNVSFDEKGDVLGSYEILNLVGLHHDRSVATPVGIWDARSEQLAINDSSITWNTHKQPSMPPSSQCGEKCKPGEIYSYLKNSCCWECSSCNKNEITILNATKCESCPRNKWPDTPNFNVCVDIPPQHVHWYEPWVIVLNILSVFGLVFSTIIFVLFVRNNEARIIKATSRELSYIMLGGVTIQYILICTSVVKPQTFVCHFNYIGFNVSFAVVYAPLLTRTNRIYRIFSSGKRTKVVPSFTSPLSQVLITICLIFVQILMNLLVTIWTPVRVKKRQPILLEDYVELVCELPERGFICSMCYNLLLVIVCTVYAFKTRALPDNFNESRCICLCVYTTLVIWLAFLPTYFTTPIAYYQVILISCALLLNATVILLCLFVPKLYGLNMDDSSRKNASSSKFISHSSSQGANMSLMNTSVVDIVNIQRTSPSPGLRENRTSIPLSIATEGRNSTTEFSDIYIQT